MRTKGKHQPKAKIPRGNYCSVTNLGKHQQEGTSPVGSGGEKTHKENPVRRKRKSKINAGRHLLRGTLNNDG